MDGRQEHGIVVEDSKGSRGSQRTVELMVMMIQKTEVPVIYNILYSQSKITCDMSKPQKVTFRYLQTQLHLKYVPLETYLIVNKIQHMMREIT